MEARTFLLALAASSALVCGSLEAASYRTKSFLVSAARPEWAKEVGDAAEKYRSSLALEWLGRELPDWIDPCPISVEVGPRMGASGQTSFVFTSDGGQPRGWTMAVRGTLERVLDSVLPHEVTHTVFATHFGRKLPRWADEGACTTVEHGSERHKQEQLLLQFLTTNRGIAFNEMFRMTEYPPDMLPLYAQGYSLARFLIAMEGKRKFIEYVGDGLRTNNWTASTREHYGIHSLSELQLTWVEWVRAGSHDAQALQFVSTQASEPSKHPARVTPRNNSARDKGWVSVPPASGHNRELEGLGDQNTIDTNPTAQVSSSWYAKQRDRAQLSQVRSESGTNVRATSVSRPSEPVRPGQILLEYDASRNRGQPSADGQRYRR